MSAIYSFWVGKKGLNIGYLEEKEKYIDRFTPQYPSPAWSIGKSGERR